jgi:hypothetical protein
LQTNDIAMPSSALVSWCTPDSDASSSTIALGVSDERATTMTWKTAASKANSGRVPLRGRGKVIGFRETIPAGASWNYANGINDVVLAAGGVR